jgi:hypothetical protein
MNTPSGTEFLKDSSSNDFTITNLGGVASANDLTAPSIEVGVWYHVALVRDRDGVTKMFLDGLKIASKSIEYTSLDRSMRIGSGNPLKPLDGNISNIRVINGNDIYSSNFTRPTDILKKTTNTVLLLNTKQGESFLRDSSFLSTAMTNSGTSSDTQSPFRYTTSNTGLLFGGSAIAWTDKFRCFPNQLYPLDIGDSYFGSIDTNTHLTASSGSLSSSVFRTPPLNGTYSGVSADSDGIIGGNVGVLLGEEALENFTVGSPAYGGTANVGIMPRGRLNEYGVGGYLQNCTGGLIYVEWSNQTRYTPPQTVGDDGINYYWAKPGTFTFKIPKTVYGLTVVCVGSGGISQDLNTASYTPQNFKTIGAGGMVRSDAFPVTPGDVFTIKIRGLGGACEFNNEGGLNNTALIANGGTNENNGNGSATKMPQSNLQPLSYHIGSGYKSGSGFFPAGDMLNSINYKVPSGSLAAYGRGGDSNTNSTGIVFLRFHNYHSYVFGKVYDVPGDYQFRVPSGVSQLRVFCADGGIGNFPQANMAWHNAFPCKGGSIIPLKVGTNGRFPLNYDTPRDYSSDTVYRPPSYVYDWRVNRASYANLRAMVYKGGRYGETITPPQFQVPAGVTSLKVFLAGRFVPGDWGIPTSQTYAWCNDFQVRPLGMINLEFTLNTSHRKFCSITSVDTGEYITLTDDGVAWGNSAAGGRLVTNVSNVIRFSAPIRHSVGQRMPGGRDFYGGNSVLVSQSKLALLSIPSIEYLAFDNIYELIDSYSVIYIEYEIPGYINPPDIRSSFGSDDRGRYITTIPSISPSLAWDGYGSSTPLSTPHLYHGEARIIRQMIPKMRTSTSLPLGDNPELLPPMVYVEYSIEAPSPLSNGPEVVTATGSPYDKNGSARLVNTFKHLPNFAEVYCIVKAPHPDNSIYLSDCNYHRIRRMLLRTNDGSSYYEISTLAGSTSRTAGFVNGAGTSAAFNEPKGICLSNDNMTLYVADSVNNAIRSIHIASGEVTTVCGGHGGFLDGIGTSAKFNHPTEISVSRDGDLYVVDSGNKCIRKVALPSGSVTTVSGEPNHIASSEDFNTFDGFGSFASLSDKGTVISYEGSDGMIYMADGGVLRIMDMD